MKKNTDQGPKNRIICNSILEAQGSGTTVVFRSRVFILDPDFFPSRIPDLSVPGSNNNKKRRGKEKFVFLPLP
jgi:hypothetical protein